MADYRLQLDTLSLGLRLLLGFGFQLVQAVSRSEKAGLEFVFLQESFFVRIDQSCDAPLDALNARWKMLIDRCSTVVTLQATLILPLDSIGVLQQAHTSCQTLSSSRSVRTGLLWQMRSPPNRRASLPGQR